MTAFTEDWNLSQFWYDLSLLKNELRTVQKRYLYLQISPIDLQIIYLLIINLENVVVIFGDSLIAGTSGNNFI
jgi:hypothetical protein